MLEQELSAEKQNGFKLFAKNIIKAKSRKIFAQSKTLSCLVKSDIFFDDILNIFNKLFHFRILPTNFIETINACELSETDNERLNLIAKLYNDYVNVMTENGWKIPFPRRLTLKNNTDISFDVTKMIMQKNRCYLEFPDIQTESLYIAKKIKDIVDSGECELKNIGVFVDKGEARQKLLDILTSMSIPVQSSIYNESYENLKHKVLIYEQISDICKNLALENFTAEDFKNLHSTANWNSISKSQKEICLTELDKTLKTFLSEVLPQSTCLEKIFTTQSESSKSLNIINLIYSSWNKFSEEEQKILSIEFGSIKTFYEHYKQFDFASAISSVIKKYLALFENTELKTIIAGKIKGLGELQNLYNCILKEQPQFAEFFEILNEPSFSQEKNENIITLGAISSAVRKKDGFKYLFLAGLTENNFPGTNISYPFVSLQTNELLTQEIKKIAPEYDFFLQTDDIHNGFRIADIKSLISLATEHIVFSTHLYEAKKSTLPASIFKMLIKNDSENFKKITEENTKNPDESNNTDNKENSNSSENDSKNNFVITENDILKLNPSAISTFQNCPRKYYYKTLLNLKEQPSFAASYGSIVHAVFELMNKKYLSSYNKKTALELADILFSSKENPQPALDKGFGQTDVDLINATNDLSLVEMKENFRNAIENYEFSGYFNQAPTKAVCEKTFSFTIDELPNVVFDGRIDAILSDEKNNTTVIDYKTGRNKINTLEYAISEFGVNFKSKTGKDPSNIETLQNTYDYQIPIYYLAIQNAENLKEYKESVKKLGLLYVRPITKDNGCDEDFVSAEKIEFYKEKIIQNLKTTIIDKILTQVEFKSSKGFSCENCSYKFLCDNGGDDD